MPKIQINDLTHYYETKKSNLHVLDSLNLTIESGDFVVILGSSGCGKSTLLNIISGLLSPFSGSIFVDNKMINGINPHASMIFQEPNLLPWYNVYENVCLGCKIKKDTKNLETRAMSLINLMGLKDFAKQYPSKLSLGMKQRASFARAVINNPGILLLDEPFTSLDYYNRTKLQKELIINWINKNYTAIFVTHSIDEALYLGQKIIILSQRPAKIQEIIEINHDYPRDLSEKKLFNCKLDIQNKFEKLKINYPIA